MKDKLSEIGHGQVPFMGDEASAAAVSFAKVTQRATLSLAQLRRVALGPDYSAEADAAARALLVALSLHAHMLAFGRGFALRSGAEHAAHEDHRDVARCERRCGDRPRRRQCEPASFSKAPWSTRSPRESHSTDGTRPRFTSHPRKTCARRFLRPGPSWRTDAGDLRRASPRHVPRGPPMAPRSPVI